MTCRECPGTVYVNIRGPKKWHGECDSCGRNYDYDDNFDLVDIPSTVLLLGFLALVWLPALVFYWVFA